MNKSILEIQKAEGYICNQVEIYLSSDMMELLNYSRRISQTYIQFDLTLEWYYYTSTQINRPHLSVRPINTKT